MTKEDPYQTVSTHTKRQNNSQTEESRAAIRHLQQGERGSWKESSAQNTCGQVRLSQVRPFSILCFSSRKSNVMNKPISLILPSHHSPPSIPSSNPTLKTPPSFNCSETPPSPFLSLYDSLHPSPPPGSGLHTKPNKAAE